VNQRSALAGSLFAGLLASVCCIGPVVLGAVGLGSLGLATALAPLRPWFLVVTGVLLAVGFFLAYRPRPAAPCVTGEECARPAHHRNQRLALWLVTVLAVALVTYPSWAARLSPTMRSAAPAKGTSALVILDVEGMTCAGCAGEIERELGKVPGVASAVVRYEQRRAEVRMASQPSRAEQLIAAVERAGYRASPARLR